MNNHIKKDNLLKKFDMGFPQKINKIITLHNEFESGYVDNTFYPFLPGIIVCLNDVHASNIPMNNFLIDKNMLLINYCISGRCEFKIAENAYKYVKDNYTSIGTYTVHDSFNYPANYYLGYEIFICKDMFTNETKKTLSSFNIDIDTIYKRYNNKDNLSLIETDIHIQRLWLELYNEKEPDNGLVRINVLKVLHYLTHSKNTVPANSTYLTKNQMRLAKTVHEMLASDLSKRISMREISEKLNVSETGLKNYFTAMYGLCISEYMKSKRLKKATELLKDTSLSICDIATSVGYSNQGRFAKLFKEYYGMSPLEYKHTYKTNKDTD